MPKDKTMPYTTWSDAVDPDSLKTVSMAFKALEKGVATEDQQKYALKFLIKFGCRTYDSDWFKDDRISSFAAGRRFVGMQIIDMINLNVGNIK